MALYRYFKPSGSLPDPSGPLSAFVSPSVIKDASDGAWHYASTYENLKYDFFLKAIRSFIRKFAPLKFPTRRYKSMRSSVNPVWQLFEGSVYLR